MELESGVVYQSSLAKSAESVAGLNPRAKLDADAWNAKSSTELMSVPRTYGAVLLASASYTSPNMKKSGLPCAWA